jgi:hypothetical protein
LSESVIAHCLSEFIENFDRRFAQRHLKALTQVSVQALLKQAFLRQGLEHLHNSFFGRNIRAPHECSRQDARKPALLHPQQSFANFKGKRQATLMPQRAWLQGFNPIFPDETSQRFRR